MSEEMTDTPYSEPVAQLLMLGEPSGLGAEWRDYLAMGLSLDDVTALVRMATDKVLHGALHESTEVWAPIHAWRALGQLRAEAAIEPLTGLFQWLDGEYDDWVGEEMPRVMGLIGPQAIPVLEAYMQDGAHGEWARICAGECIGRIGLEHPDARDTCVAALTRQLERFSENGENANAFLVSDLVDLGAVEAAPVMERAFAADAVELSVVGDWEEAQVELGLLAKRITPQPAFRFLGSGAKLRGLAPPVGKSREKAKKKNKDQKKARKKNRRK